MAEAHAHQGSAAPRKTGPARRVGPSLICLQPHAIAPSCETPTLVTSLPAPSSPACPDLAQLLHTAVAQAFNAVVITNAALDGEGPCITYCNPAFCRMTGYTEQELLGRSPRLLQGPKTDPQVLQRLRECLRSGTFFQGSTVNYRKDGSSYLVVVEHFPRARCPGPGASLRLGAARHHQAGACRAAPGLAGTRTERHARCRADRR